MKLDLTDAERYSNEWRLALAVDDAGHETLIGLTVDESIFYIDRKRKFLSGNRDEAGRKLWLELNEKHERARLQIVGAVAEKENTNPSMN